MVRFLVLVVRNYNNNSNLFDRKLLELYFLEGSYF